MTTWNYRLIKHEENESDVWYGVHEVYYNKDGTIWAWTEDAFLISDTEEEMFEILQMILRDLGRSPILVHSELPEYIEDIDEQ